MELHEEIRDGVAVLRLVGEPKSGPEIAPLQDRIKSLVDEGVCSVVVDFEKVNWFGSCVLGVLAGSLLTLKREGGDLRLSNLDNKLKRIFSLARMDEVYQVFDTADLAVASFEVP